MSPQFERALIIAGVLGLLLYGASDLANWLAR